MAKAIRAKCPTCGKAAHNFKKVEALNCVPPKDVLQFGEYIIDKVYRDVLYEKHPRYTSEEVVGSYLGHNPYYPSQSAWFVQEDED